MFISSSLSENAVGGLHILLFILFVNISVKSDLISQRLLDTGQSWRQQRGACFKGAPMPTAEGQTQNPYMTSSIFPICSVLLFPGNTLRGLQQTSTKAATLTHTYSTMTAERIDTSENPHCPQYKQGPTIHMP